MPAYGAFVAPWLVSIKDFLIGKEFVEKKFIGGSSRFGHISIVFGAAAWWWW